MKNIYKVVCFLLLVFTSISCEEVVDIDLNTAAPKLVIDANIQWQKGTSGNIQKIKISTTSNFYSTTIPPVNGATVTVTNTNTNTPFQFLEDQQTGVYFCTNFTPLVGDDYTLTVLVNGQTYTATAPFMPTPSIQNTTQTLKPGFGGEDFYEIRFYFQDNAQTDNFYLASVKAPLIVYPEYGAFSDEFTQGELMYAVYQDELKKGDVLNYNIQGITEKYNNYMSKLLNIAGTDGGNPFATAPATLRGNIINTSQPNNFPFGYFHLSEIDSGTYTVE